MGMCSASEAQNQVDPSQTALNQAYLTQLTASNAYSKEMQPFAEKAAGYTRDENGNLRAMTDAEKYANMSQSEKDTYDVGQLATARQKLAYEGKIPLTQADIQAQQNEFNNVQEALSRTGTKITGDSFGNAIANSTAGAQNIADRLKYWGARTDAQSRGEIDSGTANMLNLYNAGNQYGLSNVGKATNLSTYGTGLLNNYAQAGNYFNQQQQLANQIGMFNAGASNANKAGQMQMIGTVLGGATGGYLSRS